MGLLRVLEKRPGCNYFDYDLFLELEGAGDILTRDEKDDVTTCGARMRNSKVETKGYNEELRTPD
jgi:hypothetical protein